MKTIFSKLRTVSFIFVLLLTGNITIPNSLAFFTAKKYESKQNIAIGVIPEGITAAFRNGDAHALASFLNNSITLTIINKSDVYSRTQAELILKDFFSKNQPQNFMILNQGSREVSKYAVGNLVSENARFKVSFVLITVDDKTYINTLKIESQD